jgi:hypothetical protein
MRGYLPEVSIRTQAWQMADGLVLGLERTPVDCRAYIRMWAEEGSKAVLARVVPCLLGRYIVRPSHYCACCAFLGLDFC